VAGCVLFVVAAVVIALQFIGGHDATEVVPDDSALRAPWGCQHCGHLVHLTPRDRVRMEAKASKTDMGGRPIDDKRVPDDGRTSFRELVLTCPKCGRRELRQAATCPRCHTPFVPQRQGTPQPCPICNWSP
jgi:hypothetical protein